MARARLRVIILLSLVACSRWQLSDSWLDAYRYRCSRANSRGEHDGSRIGGRLTSFGRSLRSNSPSPLFAAHWGFFIPSILPHDSISRRHEESPVGRRIHVSGDRLNGFNLEVIRDYDIRKHRSLGIRRFPIAIISPKYLETSRSDDQGNGKTQRILKDKKEGGGHVDNRLVDSFEEVCLRVEAPGPSLNHVGKTNSARGRRVKAVVMDCQWWICQVVDVLTSEAALGAFPARQDGGEIKRPKDAVAGLPVH